MKTASLAIAAAAVSSIAVTQAAVQPLVVGGTKVPIGEKTWMVGLRYGLNQQTQCGGMLITPTHVLSAGHCPTFGYAAVGTHYSNNSTDGEQIKIVGDIRHPNYFEPDDNAATWDYKIIQLEKPAQVAPVPILINDPTVDPIVGKYATSIGWGSTREGGGGSNELLRVDVQLKTMDECAAMGMSPLDETMVCAGGVEGKDTCNGDSGGPLFLETSQGDVVVGIVSWGNGCACKDQTGVYSRVSHVLDWIKTNAPGATFVSYPDN